MNSGPTTHGSQPAIHVTVVAAVVERGGLLLVTRRQKGVHLEGCWEFPGGKVEADETHQDALRREIREELGAAAEVGNLVYSTVYAYPEHAVSLFFYACELADEPLPLLGQEMRWVPRADLGQLTFPPADAELITRLMRTAAR